MKNSKLKTQNSKLIQPAFTLIELMIVVSILGILAAIVLPEFQNHQKQAKEAQAKANLRTLRDAIERYHATYGVAPGYYENDTSRLPAGFIAKLQLEGDLLVKIPQNPINGLSTINAIHDDDSFPSEPNNTSGWIYKPASREIRLNAIGTDNEEKAYFYF